MRRVHEGRPVREGNGCGSYRSASWRHETVLGPEQLAGPVPQVPFEEDQERGSDAPVSLLKSLFRSYDRQNHADMVHTIRRAGGRNGGSCEMVYTIQIWYT